MNRMMDWGESMYGGYYATLIIDEKVVGVHARTQKELKEEIKNRLGQAVKLTEDRRRDN